MTSCVATETSHKKVVVKFGDQTAEVDELLAPLIEELWKSEIDTGGSCQEINPGTVWIEFPRGRHAEKFLDIVARFEKGVATDYNRMARDLTNEDGRLTKDSWEYEVNPIDVEHFFDDDDRPQKSEKRDCCFFLEISVYFPLKDLPIVLDRMREFNRATESDPSMAAWAGARYGMP